MRTDSKAGWTFGRVVKRAPYSDADLEEPSSARGARKARRIWCLRLRRIKYRRKRHLCTNWGRYWYILLSVIDTYRPRISVAEIGKILVAGYNVSHKVAEVDRGPCLRQEPSRGFYKRPTSTGPCKHQDHVKWDKGGGRDLRAGGAQTNGRISTESGLGYWSGVACCKTVA